MTDVVMVSAVRTPIGGFNGALADVGATDLGGLVINTAVARAGIEPADVDEVIMGQVLPCGYGQNPGRQAALKAGLPWTAGAITVNKVCGSGLKAVMLAAQAIGAGDAQIVVAGGMESMTRAPYFLPRARFGYRMGPGTIEDHMMHDGLWDIVNDFHMGMSNELCAEKYGVSRADQDAFAAKSYRRAMAAMAEGRFADEIVPVPLPKSRKGPNMFAQDECPRETALETLAAMRPAFSAAGTGTAGNASVLADGAAAVVLMSRARAEKIGADILVEIGAQAAAGIDLKYVLVAPIHAIPKCLAKEGIRLSDVDLFEINEAFSGSTLAVLRELGIDPARVNVNGGAVALGHPIGASGARVLVTLVHEMRRRKNRIGLASLCLGGGEAVALVVRRP